jgi:hypothetical protein
VYTNFHWSAARGRQYIEVLPFEATFLRKHLPRQHQH